MILPLGITAGRTRILPTIELNSLPLLIKEYCAVRTVTNNSPCQLGLNGNKTGIASGSNLINVFLIDCEQ